jgi:Cytochrome C oxidase, cbb3-type, subunit III
MTAGLIRTLFFMGLLAMSPMSFTAEFVLPKPAAHLDGIASAPVTVVEPHLSTPLKPVQVTYTGYPALPLLDHWLGSGWRRPDAVIGFEAEDGYLSMVPSVHLLRYPAYLVYARADGDDFSVELPPLKHREGLGPWYLVWDNLVYSELQADGSTYWPYQIKRISVIDPDRLARLYPPMLPERYRDGAALTEKYCLSCHQVNGVGGKKLPIDLGQWAATQSFARFATWVLDPSGKNPLTAMPALAPEKPAAERQMMARQIYGYLRAVGALGK